MSDAPRIKCQRCRHLDLSRYQQPFPLFAAVPAKLSWYLVEAKEHAFEPNQLKSLCGKELPE